MLSDIDIELAKQKIIYSYSVESLHEHNDCIRIAYEWLDAQKKIMNPISKCYALKHIIEKWGGRYVSRSDVELAAFLHPAIQGKYPNYNISARLTEPDAKRLRDIGEAFKHQNYRDQYDSSIYKEQEKEFGNFLNIVQKGNSKLTRNEKLRNLLVAGVNEAIERKLIDLNSLDDTKGHFQFQLYGKLSRFSWSGNYDGEIMITIWWGVKQNCKGIEDGAVTRPNNKHIKDA